MPRVKHEVFKTVPGYIVRQKDVEKARKFMFDLEKKPPIEETLEFEAYLRIVLGEPLSLPYLAFLDVADWLSTSRKGRLESCRPLNPLSE